MRGVYPPATTLQGVRPRLYWPIALAAAALVALLTYGVAAQGPDTSIDQKLQEGKRVEAPGGKLSIADALMAPIPGAVVFELAKDLLAPGFAVSDAELERAVVFAAQKLKLLVEPGGAAGLAALLAGRVDARGKTVAVVLSGGNAEFDAIAQMLGKSGAPA